MRGLVVPLLERINRETTAIVTGAECVMTVGALFLTGAAFVIQRGRPALTSCPRTPLPRRLPHQKDPLGENQLLSASTRL